MPTLGLFSWARREERALADPTVFRSAEPTDRDQIDPKNPRIAAKSTVTPAVRLFAAPLRIARCLLVGESVNMRLISEIRRPDSGAFEHRPSLGVVAGLVPAASTVLAQCLQMRGRRDKPGDDALSDSRRPKSA